MSTVSGFRPAATNPRFGTDQEFEFRDGAWVTDPQAPPEDPIGKAPPVDHGAGIISAERYYSRETMQLEWDRLWTKVWNLVGLASDIPKVGDYFRCEIGREAFIIVRAAPDKIKGFYNVCSHRGNQIVYNDFGTVRSFVCAFHSWRYSLDGKLDYITNKKMFPPQVICDRPGLKEVRVDVCAGLVFLNMDEQPEDLRTFLDVLPEHFAPYKLETYRVLKDVVQEWDANWKTAVDAFVEAYHSHAVHPQLNAVLDEIRCQYDCYGHGHNRMITPLNLVSIREPRPKQLNEGLGMILQQFGVDPATYDGPVDNIRKTLAAAKRGWAERYGIDWSGLTDSQLVNFMNYQLFPNVTISLTGDSYLIQQWRPHATDPEKLYYHVIALVPPVNSSDATLADISDSDYSVRADLESRPPRVYSNGSEEIGVVLAQDREQIPRQQKALRSRSFRGMRFGNEEIRSRHYLAEVDRYLAAD